MFLPNVEKMIKYKSNYINYTLQYKLRAAKQINFLSSNNLNMT